METFVKPHLAIGYAMFDFETKCFRGKYNKLSDLRNFALKHNMLPENTVVFRVFEPDMEDSDRRLMDLSEIAFLWRSKKVLSNDIILDVEEWHWEPQTL